METDIPEIPAVTVAELAARYGAVLLDAYGVLVDGTGALPGAVQGIQALTRTGVAWAVVTNDASRQPETAARRFRALGLEVPAERVVSSGDLLPGLFAARGLLGARCVVLGSGDSRASVQAAGGVVIHPRDAHALDVLVVCDEAGYPFLETLGHVLSGLFQAVDAGRTPVLVLPNPDLVYPRAPGRFGFTAGTVAEMFERALALRYPCDAGWTFVRLGKPYEPIFAAACARVGTRDAVMVGDQLVTDIAGARAFGIASALVATGLTRLDEARRSPHRPTYLVTGW